MELITGVANTPHVTSTQHRSIFESIIGPDSYILNKGALLEPGLEANNAVQIASGMLCHHGGIAEVAANTYDEITVSNGTQGMKRIDLIVARYERNAETQIETMAWKVIQGEPAETNPTMPDFIQGNMQEGDLIDDCPAFAVHLDGIQITEIKKLLTVVLTDMHTMREDVDGVREDVDGVCEDSGWVALTPDGNYEAISAHPPRVRKIGKYVELSGGVRNTANSIAGTSTQVRLGITLPQKFRPSKMIIKAGYTHTSRVFQLRINTDGTVTASCSFAAGDAAMSAMPANTSVFFHAFYFVN